MHKRILITSDAGETRVVVLEDGRIEEHYVERRGEPQLVGSLYKGRVVSLLHGIGAAFVDIGLGKNGFLPMGEPTAREEFDVEKVASGVQEKFEGRPSTSSPLKIGSEVLVQVEKEPFRGKLARLTTDVSLAGRFLVLMPYETRIGISRRITNELERSRLRKLLDEVELPKGLGFILRTLSEGATKRDLARELKFLTSQWHYIQRKFKKMKAPTLIHAESDLIVRMVRDSFDEDVEQLVVDSRLEYKKIMRALGPILPALRSKVRLYSEEVPLFEREGVEEKIEALYDRRVELKGGGYIIIEPTEALTSIDVNSGKFAGKRRIEDMLFRLNCEAAREIARQLRLRDIGGIIAIDFIDMERPEHNSDVGRILKGALARDKAKTDVGSFSEFGVVEMTRQRIRRSLEGRAYEKCGFCEGRGMVKSVFTMSILVERKAREFLKASKAKEVYIYVNPQVGARLLGEDKPKLARLEREFHARIYIHKEPHRHIEDVEVKAPPPH